MKFKNSEVKIVRQTWQPKPNVNLIWNKPKDGDVDEVYYCDGESWHLFDVDLKIPPATTNTIGGVKIGDGISVTQDGTISVQGGDNPIGIDTTIPDNPVDTRVPSTKLMVDEIAQLEQGIDAKIATKANQSEVDKLKQDFSSVGYKKVGEYTFLNDRRIVGVESVDFANKTVRTKEPHGITTTTEYASTCYFVLKNSKDAPLYGQDDTFKYASESLNIVARPTSIIDEYTISFSGITNNSNANFNASYYDMHISSDNNYQRKIALTEPCNEYKVIVKLSKYNGGIGDLDSSGGAAIKRSVGSSVTEYYHYNSGMYSTRCVLIYHFGRSPKFDGTTTSVNTNATHYAFDRTFTNRNPVSNFQFYNSNLPYVAGDKVEVYKIS